MIPVLKWAGGKRQIISRLDEIILPKLCDNNTLFVPFVGGGSVFISLQHRNVFTYISVKKSTHNLFAKMICY